MTPYRWFIISFYALNQVSGAMAMVGFAPVAQLMIEAYDVTAFETTFLVLIFHLLYIPLNFPANYLMDKFGMVLPTLISGFALIIGAWI